MNIFLNKNLSKNMTGIEHAALKRFFLFKENNLNAYYATSIFNKNIIDFADHYKVGRDNILNPYLLYLDLRKFEFKENSLNLEGKKVRKVNNRDHKIYHKEILLMYVCYDENGYIEYINYFFNNKIFKREFYYKGNIVLDIQFYYLKNESKEKIVERYFNNKGQVVIEKFFLENNNLSKILLNFNSKYIFQSEKDFINFWLNNLVDSVNGNVSLYIDRPFRYNEAVFEITNKKVKKIGIIHALHYNHYRDHLIGNMLIGYKQYFDNLEKLDKIVVGTELQKKDLKERFGKNIPVSVIPPGYALSYPNYAKKHTNSHKKIQIISVGRLSPEKRIDHMLNALGYLNNLGYDFEFNIFGLGSELNSLKDLVKNLNLEDKVIFCGYSNEIIEHFLCADISLVTSTFEGFNLSIIESFSCGVPVIAYDIKYGPKELIRNDYNGYLVKDSSPHDIANKIEELIKDRSKLKYLSQNAFETSHKFYKSIIMEKWSELLNEIN